MATPYSVLRLEEAPSTQDLARARYAGRPVLVVADRQTEGRGRSGNLWESAPRAMAASLAFQLPAEDRRAVLSLIAGIAASRVLGDSFGLKWPNDVMSGEEKVGGILVEASGDLAVVGFGLNLWWPEAPIGIGAVHRDDPGVSEAGRTAELWAGELLVMVSESPWPQGEYRDRCVTLGRRLTWQPDGSGLAIDVAADGSLVVETDQGVIALRSGAVAHVRREAD